MAARVVVVAIREAERFRRVRRRDGLSEREVVARLLRSGRSGAR
jgi:dephospho-CoA kinase